MDDFSFPNVTNDYGLLPYKVIKLNFSDVFELGYVYRQILCFLGNVHCLLPVLHWQLKYSMHRHFFINYVTMATVAPLMVPCFSFGLYCEGYLHTQASFN